MPAGMALGGDDEHSAWDDRWRGPENLVAAGPPVGTYDCAEPEPITWLRKDDKLTARLFNNTKTGHVHLWPLALEAYHRGPPAMNVMPRKAGSPSAIAEVVGYVRTPARNPR